MNAPTGLPLIVLTGFLGSGKTTLLNRWLRSPRLRDTAVLINEFGEVGLDHQLVETVDGAPVLLANGCICCTIREDLKTALLRLAARRLAGEVPPYQRVIVETTGAADPAPILATLLTDPELRHHYHVGSVVTVVDSVNGPRDLRGREDVRRQVALADRLLLSKTDQVDAAALDTLIATLAAMNPAAPRLPALAFDPTLLHDSPAHSREADLCDWLAQAASAAAHDHAAHGQRYGSFVLVLDEAVDWTAFGVWLTLLLHVHGTRILRVKGLLTVAGSATPVVVNGVQHLVHPPWHLPAWPDDDHRSRLVFITEGLDEARVRASFAAFNAAGHALRPAADSSP